MKILPALFILGVLLGCALTFYSSDALDEKISRMDSRQKKKLEKKYMTAAITDMKELRLEMAVQKLKIVRKLNPENRKALRYLVKIYRSVDLNKKAVHQLHELIKLDPQNIWALRILGVLYLDMGRYAEAVPCFIKLVSIDTGLVEAYYYLGYIYSKQAKNEQARSYLKQFKEKAGEPGTLSAERAEVLKKMVEQTDLLLKEMEQ
jgi:tetratricopeptide (TPR) repeat protein